MRIAAIDLGSNAVRLAIAKCGGDSGFEIIKKIRKPLRLGTEAFSASQAFSEETFDKSLKTFQSFADLMAEERVEQYKAFATSAFRDAKNSTDLAFAIKETTGIQIKKMTGNLEAEVILNSVLQKMKLDSQKNYLLFDLGGGSLELSKIEQGVISGSKSFDLGTVRLMSKINEDKNKLSNILQSHQKDIERFLSKKNFNQNHMSIIGTGGNFRRLLKIRNLEAESKKKYLNTSEFWGIKAHLEKLSFEERIKAFDLRPDRADVIVPAAEIIGSVLKSLDVSKIFAPNVGLVEGILENLSEQFC